MNHVVDVEMEQHNVPSQLVQHFIQIPCKWKLAALISFLKLHSKEKILVFFSTCDAVDYHALLLQQANWPMELDDEGDGGTAPVASSGLGDKPLPVDGDMVGSGVGLKKNRLVPSTSSTAVTNSKHSNQSTSSSKPPIAAVGSARRPSPNVLEPLSTSFTSGLFDPSCALFRLHGSVPQRVRQQVYSQFCAAARSSILLCTDVAARGLDLPAVDWIIQYDPPCDTTEYVHRIGRTARRGLRGSSLLFLLPSEMGYLTLLSTHGLRDITALQPKSIFLQTSKFIPGTIGEYVVGNIYRWTTALVLAAVIAVVLLC